MLSIQELLPHIELLESDERLAVMPAPRPYSVVAVGSVEHEDDRRWSPAARLVRLAWVSMTCAQETHVVFGSESILVGPGEDLEASRLIFSMARAGELLEAHPAGTVGLLGGALPPLEGVSDEFANGLLEALGRARASEATLMGYVPHPCPSLFKGWLPPGERTPWSRSSGLLWCYVNVEDAILRLEAYEIAPGHEDRAVAIAVSQFRKGFPKVPLGVDAPSVLAFS